MNSAGCSTSSFPWFAVLAVLCGTVSVRAENVVAKFEFSKQQDGPAKDALKASGFEIKKIPLVSNDFNNPDRTKLSIKSGKLYLTAKQPAFGLLFHNRTIGECSKIRLTWGVDRYPENASYAKKVNNEAVMVYVYFGKQTIASGSLFVPKLPFFIGLYPSNSDRVGKHYLGKYYHKGGRFACVASPKERKLVVTNYDLAENFKREFSMDRVPPVSGFAIELDTTDSGDGGKSSAFIQKIEFIK